MDVEFLSLLGRREGLIAIVVLLVAYVAVVFLRMRRLKRMEAQARAAPLSFSASAAVAAYGAGQVAPESPAPTGPRGVENASGEASTLGSSDFPFPWNEPPSSNSQEQRIVTLEVEVDQLRKEVGGLRAELMLMREARQNEEPKFNEEPRISVAQLIAPQYSEAMQLALKDVDAASISQQCGITRAEAELVAALVRNRDN